MEVESAADRKFEVKINNKYVVKATNPSQETHNHVLALSNLDLLSGRFPVTYLYFYNKPLFPQTSSYLIESLSCSLAETLNHFYPFAGRIIQNQDTNEPVIICDNTGALLAEAYGSFPLNNLDFYDLNKLLEGKLVSLNSDFPFQIQVTRFRCGGISLTFTFDHALGDASSFGKFLTCWSEIATKKPLSCRPDHSREIYARSPPTYNPLLDEIFLRCSIEEITNMPTSNICVKRLYYIDASSINKLQLLACEKGNKRTKIEAFSAYIWKIMVNTIDKSHQICKMGWLVDGRGRFRKQDKDFTSNYIGNVLSIAVGEASVIELKQSSICEIAGKVNNAILKVANEDHFLDLIDWIECHRPGLMLSKVVLGRGGPALVLSSGRRFPVAELDFGFGRPVMGTVCSTIERIGVGYMNQRPSGKGDGSWTLSAILWPQLASALESDPIFQPMAASHLQV